jgi:hypothetical protein
MRRKYINGQIMAIYYLNMERIMDTAVDSIFTKIGQSLPPVFTRDVAVKSLGGLIQAKTLSNIDNRGEGPMSKVRVGKKVLYEREDFIDWLKKYNKF